jgi:hypothetical protein
VLNRCWMFRPYAAYSSCQMASRLTERHSLAITMLIATAAAFVLCCAAGDLGGERIEASSSEQQQGINCDQVSTAQAGSSPLVFSHSVNAGVNNLLLVGVSLRNAAGQTVTSVTFGGQALTFIGTATQNFLVRAEMWRLIAPTAGAQNEPTRHRVGTKAPRACRPQAISKELQAPNLVPVASR